MTNLDSVLKSKDITLLAKVHRVAEGFRFNALGGERSYYHNEKPQVRI